MTQKMQTVFFLILCFVSFGQAQSKATLSEPERYKLAAQYSEQNNGSAVLVMKGDKIVFEDYENGFTSSIPHFLASGSKSFVGVMAVAAQEDGLLNLDDKVSATITEWQADPVQSQVTIRQLLSLSSGIDVGQNLFPPSFAKAVEYKMKHAPGEFFEYGPVPFQVFGELMRRKLAPKNETVSAYLDRRILNPIGMKIAFWHRLGGELDLPGGAFATAGEWAKFGLFLKNGGSWNGKQIISKKLLDECFVGTKANPAYGVSFWLNEPGINPAGNKVAARAELSSNGVDKALAKDLFMAAGVGNQRLYVIRSLDLVVVRQGNFGDFDDREFLGRLILGAVK